MQLWMQSHMCRTDTILTCSWFYCTPSFHTQKKWKGHILWTRNKTGLFAHQSLSLSDSCSSLPTHCNISSSVPSIAFNKPHFLKKRSSMVDGIMPHASDVHAATSSRNALLRLSLHCCSACPWPFEFLPVNLLAYGTTSLCLDQLRTEAPWI